MSNPTSKKFKNIYMATLYRLRNAVAHGEFKIFEDFIVFRNSEHGTINLKAYIELDKIDDFISELQKYTLEKEKDGTDLFMG